MAGKQVIIDGPSTKTVKNALVAIVGINEYHKNTHWKSLEGVTGDVEKSIKLWSEYFCYDTTVLANKSNENEEEKKSNNRSKIYYNDVTEFMRKKVRNPLQNENNNYDALIFMLFGHGENEALITSDCTPIYYDEIRRYFAAKEVGINWAAHHMRLFIVDTCRGSKLPYSVDIPSRGGYNPKTVNNDSNICTYYATTKDHAVGDQNLFIDVVDKAMRSLDLDKYTLYEVITKIAEKTDGKSASWYCPEFASTNKFKIKLQKRGDVEKGEVTYYELEGRDKEDNEIVMWNKVKQQVTKPSKDQTWWDWFKYALFRYGPWTLVTMLIIYIMKLKKLIKIQSPVVIPW